MAESARENKQKEEDEKAQKTGRKSDKIKALCLLNSYGSRFRETAISLTSGKEDFLALLMRNFSECEADLCLSKAKPSDKMAFLRLQMDMFKFLYEESKPSLTRLQEDRNYHLTIELRGENDRSQVVNVLEVKPEDERLVGEELSLGSTSPEGTNPREMSFQKGQMKNEEGEENGRNSPRDKAGESGNDSVQPE